MARQVIEMITDDLDGSEGAETLTFALEGATYEIDLTPENADKLRATLLPYIEASRKVSGAAARRPASGRRGKAASDGKADPKAIRAWAHEQGLEVPGRGRIPSSILEQYRAAH